MSADSNQGAMDFNQGAMDSNQGAMYPTEFINSIMLPSILPHRLYLKKYASVILLRSLDPPQGLCNGSRLTVIKISSHVIDGKLQLVHTSHSDDTF